MKILRAITFGIFITCLQLISVEAFAENRVLTRLPVGTIKIVEGTNIVKASSGDSTIAKVAAFDHSNIKVFGVKPGWTYLSILDAGGGITVHELEVHVNVGSLKENLINAFPADTCIKIQPILEYIVLRGYVSQDKKADVLKLAQAYVGKATNVIDGLQSIARIDCD